MADTRDPDQKDPKEEDSNPEDLHDEQPDEQALASKYGPDASDDDSAGPSDPLDEPRESAFGAARRETELRESEKPSATDDPGVAVEEPDADSLDAPEIDTNDAETATPPPSPSPPRRGLLSRLGGFLTFVMALAAVAGVAYLYYLLVYLEPIDDVRAASEAADAKYQGLETSLRSELAALAQANEQALAEASASQTQRLQENESAVLESLNEAINGAPPSQREWRLAEAEYLMRIANHRVLMEGDSAGALKLLEAADEIIASLDDFALHQVRARLADEIIALRQVRRDDLQGVYLRLEAAKTLAIALPYATPAYLERDTAPPPEQTVWEEMVDELKRFVRIRTLANEESIKPLLAPDEEDYLELNLRLAFEQAQLAALRRHQAVFEQALQSARDWVADYKDGNDPGTTGVLDELEALLTTDLARDLPDVSGSLNELVEIGRAET